VFAEINAIMVRLLIEESVIIVETDMRQMWPSVDIIIKWRHQTITFSCHQDFGIKYLGGICLGICCLDTSCCRFV